MRLAVAAALGLAQSVGAGRSAEALRAFQLRRLRALLEHAWSEVPFQRRRLEAAGLAPGELRSLEDLRRLPPVDRSRVQATPARDLVARGLDPERMSTILTSGSTGEPLRIRRTTAGKRLQGLLRQRLLWRLGVRPTDHLVRLVYVRPRRPGEGRIAARFERLGLFRVSSVSCLQPADEMAARVEALRPDVLTGLPSAVAELAERVSAGAVRVAPRVVALGGEVLDPHVRRRIAGAFGVPVLDVYSCYEAGILAWECARTGELHVHGEGVLVEVLEGGETVGPGGTGEVVVTGLHGFAMPFLRYRLGDVATAGGDACDCGLPYPTLRAVRGRVVDLFPLADGRLLHPYALLEALVHEGEGWFARYQLEQLREDAVALRLVLSPAAPPDAEARLGRALERVLGPAVGVSTQVVDEIPPEPTGKVRPIVSRVGRRAPTGGEVGSVAPARGRVAPEA